MPQPNGCLLSFLVFYKNNGITRTFASYMTFWCWWMSLHTLPETLIVKETVP